MLLRGKSHRYRFDVSSGLYYCLENGAKHYFGDIVRGVYLYNEGIKHRSNMLANSYMLNEITFQNDDNVIDCGANYGDLYIWLQTKIKMKNYYAFEPGEREFSALQLNAKGSNVNKLALGEESGKKEFFISSSEADSSIIEPISLTDKTIIQMTTLDEFINKHKVKKIKSLKLEAEGYEPEILLGGMKTLKNIQFIAVNGGNERGVNKEQTMSQVANILSRQHFKMVSINFEHGRALFENLKL